MFLLKRNNVNLNLRQLSNDQAMALKGDNLRKDKLLAKQRLLASFHLKNWLRCDCKSNGPILAVRHNSGGDFCLVTIPAHGSHATKCPLYTAPSEAQRNRHDIQQPENEFNFHKKIRSVSRSENARASTGTSSVRQNTLYRLLATLLERSGLSVLDNDVDFKTCVHRITDSASSISLGGQPLNKHLFFKFDQFNNIKDHINSQDLKQWKCARPHAIVIDIVDEVQKIDNDFKLIKRFPGSRPNSFTLYSKSTSTHLHSGRMSLTKGPFIVIATVASVTTESGRSYIAPTRAYIAPLLNKSNWVVVDSTYERRVAKQILSAKSWYQDRTEMIITASKPLFYIKTDIDTCLPDFIISSESSSVILEVMGSHAEGYLERKKRTHKSMLCLGTLVEFDAYAADKGKDFNNLCYEFVKSSFNRLKRPRLADSV